MHVLTLLASSDNSSSGGALLQMGIFLLIPVAMYFLLIRPQRKRMREQAAMQRALEVGDEVLLTSGIYGFITGLDDADKVWVEIDDDVQVRVARGAIQGRVETATDAPEASAKPAGRSADDVADSSDAPATPE